MGRPRQPIELIELKGAKHLTQAEIQERERTEVRPIADDLTPPSYLTRGQKATFTKLAEQLTKLKIMGETDVDALARYVVANDLYINAVRKLRSKEVRINPDLLEEWSKLQDRYFKQCRQAAGDLGLTISSRCRLVVPEANTEPAKENKFARFEKRA